MIIIPLSRKKYAIIDDIDEYKIAKYKSWYAAKGKQTYYAYTGIFRKGKNVKKLALHNILIKCDPGKTVDHIDGNGLNCTRINMRQATPSQQAINRRIKMSRTSKFRGVSFNKSARKKPWVMQFRHEGKYFLGYFETEIEAAKKYNELSLKHHKEFGYRNFIPKH